MQHRQINPDMEINRIPPQVLQKLKQDLSMGDKEVAAMTLEEKVQALGLLRSPFGHADDIRDYSNNW